jgi:hypothetical protein
VTDFAAMTKAELVDLARDVGITGFSTMNKPDLIEALEDYETHEGDLPTAEVEQAKAEAAGHLGFPGQPCVPPDPEG